VPVAGTNVNLKNMLARIIFPLIIFSVALVRLCLCGTAAANGPFVHPPDIREWLRSSGGMMLTRENRRTWEKTYPNATLSTIYPTWTIFALTWVADTSKLKRVQVTNPVFLSYFCLTQLQWYEATVSSFNSVEVDWNRMCTLAWCN
jgi:hypothetical protein